MGLEFLNISLEESSLGKKKIIKKNKNQKRNNWKNISSCLSLLWNKLFESIPNHIQFICWLQC